MSKPKSKKEVVVETKIKKVTMTIEQRKEAKRLANMKCMSKNPQKYGSKTIETKGLYDLMAEMTQTKEVKEIIKHIEYETNNALKELEKLTLA